MTQVVQSGSVNVAALSVPQALVQIVSPGNRPIAGAATNVLGVVGSANWGPVGLPVVTGGNDQHQANFGPIQNRMYDLGTAIAVAVQQGASNFKEVRVTDGTDTAASGSYAPNQTPETATIAGSLTVGDTLTITMTPTTGNPISISYVTKTSDTTALMATGLLAALQASAAAVAAGFGGSVSGSVLSIFAPPSTLPTGAWTFTKTVGGAATETITLATGSPVATTQLTLTGLYTGSLANAATVSIGPGTAAGSTKLVLCLPNQQPEVFDSIAGNGNLLWVNIANAVNNGLNALRGPSKNFIATAGAAGTIVGPAAVTAVALTGGTDGAAGVISSTLVGVDVTPRKGMYALRNQGCSVVNLADSHDNTQWTAMLAFSYSEGCFVVGATSPGDTITNAASELSTAGIDGYGLKVMFGDWCYWYDQVNQVTRLISPASFWAGARANLAPMNSTLNMPLAGIIGTQQSYTGASYSQAQLQALAAARLNVIANPCPGGSYFGIQFGINTSSNPATAGENYSMMVNFISLSIASWAGSVIGQLQTPTQQRQAKASADNFFQGLATATPPMIGNAQGTQPWQVVIAGQATPTQVSQGYEIAAIKVTFLSVIRFFIVNLEGGQTVTVANQNTPPASFAQAG